MRALMATIAALATLAGAPTASAQTDILADLRTYCVIHAAEGDAVFAAVDRDAGSRCRGS